MKKIRIRESKVEAFMKKRGYKDIYEMKDMLLVEGYEPVIVKDKTKRDKLSLTWWWIRKVLAYIVSALYLPIYVSAYILFAVLSYVRGIVLLLMAEPERAVMCFLHPFNCNLQ
jgi:hypothetical protein